jgi:hypothetical protein
MCWGGGEVVFGAEEEGRWSLMSLGCRDDRVYIFTI